MSKQKLKISVCLALLSLSTACGISPSSNNTYNGDGLNHLCILSTGDQQVIKLVDLSVVSKCVELSGPLPDDYVPATGSKDAPMAPNNSSLSTPLPVN